MQGADSECLREIDVLFSIVAQQQRRAFIPIELGPVPRKLSPADCGFQHPIDLGIMPPPERFLRKKKARNLLKQACPQSLHLKLKPIVDSKLGGQSQEGDEYDRVLEKLFATADESRSNK